MISPSLSLAFWFNTTQAAGTFPASSSGNLPIQHIVSGILPDCDPPLNPIPYLTLKTHYRVVTEVDQEKGRCPDDRFDPMSNWPKAQNETSQGSRMTSLTDHRARKTLYAAFQVGKLYKRVIKLG
ncbi:hypothetical protein KY290_003363 [Solanum tuberosum]|uniref:Uncharacterized protein n=1 Tax=Solanum tuberosum TaxID=4113 RepID=A0ABQ7WGV1_SOLTU|nr:hypothetical protein KY284_037410 [Solanum tuberosum]KAH0637699.1 hypothetical protein KY289_037614 [Solanum tuberosum]KAH0640853.1 hypothetical protein KY285_037439 [Solanum tuberosum]KAH0652014.1 hypothetical protein KY284_031926 [Solanum tuberosum]KAH0654234.1 hypothetical protein KY289_031912 [Solanum tuberosum]